jgi:hypothetical protein
MGAVELNVKPNRADVWVDGRYVAQARDLDGYPTYSVAAGRRPHLQVYKDGFKLFDEQIDVRRGMRSELKIKLEPGRVAGSGAEARREVLDRQAEGREVEGQARREAQGREA